MSTERSGLKHKPKPPKKCWGRVSRKAIPFVLIAALALPLGACSGGGLVSTFLSWIPGSPPGIEEVQLTPRQRLVAAEQTFELVTGGLTSLMEAGVIKKRQAALVVMVKNVANQALKNWSESLTDAGKAQAEGRFAVAAKLEAEAVDFEAEAQKGITQLSATLAKADAKQAEGM